MSAHFLAQHDYDDVAARVWHVGDMVVSFDRTGVISWSWFNYNPSHFCTEGCEQTFADLIDTGPPADCARYVEPPILEEMRAHLLQRKPGSSTFLTLATAQLRDVEGWSVDGISVRARDFAGPSYAGTGEWRGIEGFSVLVAPGAHRVEVRVRGTVVVRDVTIQRAEHVAIAI